MLPYLKFKQESSASGGDNETEHRRPDDTDFDMLDAVCNDMMEAIDRKDRTLLKDALTSLIIHIQTLDAEQDEEEI